MDTVNCLERGSSLKQVSGLKDECNNETKIDNLPSNLNEINPSISVNAETPATKTIFSQKRKLSQISNNNKTQKLELLPKKKKKIKRRFISKIPSPHSFLLNINRKDINDNISNHSKNQNNIKNDNCRRYEHLAGNWPMHIFIPIDIQLHPKLNSFTDTFITTANVSSNKTTKDTLIVDIHKVNEYHISLCISQPIRKHQMSDIIKCLNDNLQKHMSFEISFHLSQKYTKCYSNMNEKRVFLSVLVKYGSGDICGLIESVNDTLNHWGLQVFHENPQPHISLLWSSLSLDSFSNAVFLNRNNEGSEEDIKMRVKQVMIKIGDRIYTAGLNNAKAL